MTESPQHPNLLTPQDMTSAARKTYHAPTLRRYGNVRDLTRTSTTFSGNDGGIVFPNQYAS